MLMDERKLIQFGKSAFCITLPHTWLKKNHLKKGDTLSVQESLRNSLEVVPMNAVVEGKNELSIDITEKSTDEIIQLLLSTYLNGYTLVTLVGPNAGKVAFVRKHVHEFIAAEIMEVTSNKIVIHVFWDVATINLQSIITRIGHITKSIFSETEGSLDTAMDVNDITEKGLEVQRQVLLARRAIKYALNNSATAHKFNLSSLELLYFSYIIYFFGMIADYVLKLAEIIDKEKISGSKIPLKDQASLEGLKALIQRSSDYYGSVLDAYNKHSKMVKFVFSEYADFEDAIDNFRRENPQAWVPLLAEYLKLLIFKIKETEFIMISMENAPK
jgi:phosphate uptake regulator